MCRNPASEAPGFRAPEVSHPSTTDITAARDVPLSVSVKGVINYRCEVRRRSSNRNLLSRRKKRNETRGWYCFKSAGRRAESFSEHQSSHQKRWRVSMIVGTLFKGLINKRTFKITRHWLDITWRRQYSRWKRVRVREEDPLRGRNTSSSCREFDRLDRWVFWSGLKAQQSVGGLNMDERLSTNSYSTQSVSHRALAALHSYRSLSVQRLISVTSQRKCKSSFSNVRICCFISQ